MPSQDNRPDLFADPGLALSSYTLAMRYMPNKLSRWLLVDVVKQRVFLARDRQVTHSWPVSTSTVGLDNRQDSAGTPPGVHRIERKIGADAAVGTVFSSREPVGRIWSPSDDTTSDDLILTRILTLRGLEDGINRGPGIDSLERYIYLHGTNHEEHIGTPCSGGCVRLTNVDVCELFDLVEEGDPVVIV